VSSFVETKQIFPRDDPFTGTDPRPTDPLSTLEFVTLRIHFLLDYDFLSERTAMRL